MYKTMDQWLNEVENYGCRFERLLADLTLPEPHRNNQIRMWLQVAWMLGEKAAATEVIRMVVDKSDKLYNSKLEDEGHDVLAELLSTTLEAALLYDVGNKDADS